MSYALKVEKREVGKSVVKSLRKQDLVPASLFGKNEKPVALSINKKDILQLLKDPKCKINTISLDIDGKTSQALLREVQLHVVTGEILHVNLLNIKANTLATIDIPVSYINADASPSLRFGGRLNIIYHTVPVLCKPQDAPEEFVFDLKNKTSGFVFKVSDIQLPKNAKVRLPGELAISSVQGKGGGAKVEAESEA